MKNNFLKKLSDKNVVTEHKDIKEELKDTLHCRWEKQAEASEGAFDELYDQMVAEAVLVIKESWRNKAEYSDTLKYPVNETRLEAYNAFFITAELKLYSDNLYYVRNPKTGCDCFFSAFTFPSEELVENYIKDVLARLPEGTTYEKIEKKTDVFGVVNKYSFTIELIDLQD